MKWLKRVGVSGVLAVVFWFAAAWLAPFPDHLMEPQSENLRLLDGDGRVLRRVLSSEDMDRDWISLEETGRWMTSALVSAEDKRFQQHLGIDPIAIMRSTVMNMKNGRVLSGASTISTQVIRMSEPRPRNVRTKVIEFFRATQMELRYSKDEILEQYVNRIPMGGNRYGVAVASRRYYGKEVDDLAVHEAGLLAGLPQSPSRFRPDRHLRQAQQRREMVLRRMQEDLGGLEPALNPERGSLYHAPSFHAPHFCDWVLQSNEGAQDDVRTTLDPDLQARVEAVVAGAQQITDGIAVVVLDPLTGEVRAMVGGRAYGEGMYGNVNAATRRRAPGSTLKPFAYAMAMQQGWLTPHTILGDEERRYAGYQPENMSGLWNQEVTTQEALVRSLNAPALKVVGHMGVQRFVTQLRSNGFRFRSAENASLGLGVVLGGGVECSLLALCEAYAPFANGGYEVRARGTTGGTLGERVYHEGVAWWMTRMLSGDERLQALFGHQADAAIPALAFKTGTSHGHRDAWAIGWTPRYVVGVWVGMLDGRMVHGLSGLQHAAPILGKLVREVAGDGDRWTERPADLVTRNGREMIVGITQVHEDSPGKRRTSQLRILSPANGEIRFVPPGETGVTLPVRMKGEGHLFCNGRWVGETKDGALVVRLSEGKHRLRFVSVSGETDKVIIGVERI